MEIDLDVLKNFEAIIGCDEVGRGPIAGPVNACAAKITKSNKLILKKLIELNVTDSKKLSDKKRNVILEKLHIDTSNIVLNKVYSNNILGEEFSYCVTEHTHEEIDQMNILQASLSAMKNASDQLVEKDSKVLIDGNKIFKAKCETEAVVKGDSKVVAIGLASIIAKVFRDEKMKAYDKQYPGYNLGKHAGYPTKEHRNAVQKIGPSPIHRKTFKGVKEFFQ
jgi:ribonuclease HII